MTQAGLTGVYFNSGGYRLLGTLYLAQGEGPKPTALILHGMPGIEKNCDIALALRESGWNSLIFHYRGCWGSEGVYDFPSIPADVSAAMDYLSSGTHETVDVTQGFTLIGHSMGGWAAVLAAAEDKRVRQAVVYGAVCDPRQFTWTTEIIEANYTPWLPGYDAEAFLADWAALDASMTPTEQVKRISPRPLLIIHGDNDEVIPVFQADGLYRNADQSVTKLVIHPEAGHSFQWQRPWLIETIWQWLQDRV